MPPSEVLLSGSAWAVGGEGFVLGGWKGTQSPSLPAWLPPRVYACAGDVPGTKESSVAVVLEAGSS